MYCWRPRQQDMRTVGVHADREMCPVFIFSAKSRFFSKKRLIYFKECTIIRNITEQKQNKLKNNFCTRFASDSRLDILCRHFDDAL